MGLRTLSLFVLGGLSAVDAISYPSYVGDASSLARSIKNAISYVPNTLHPRKDGGGGGCPAIWTNISADLTTSFLGSDGQCTDMARAAIRFAFHDAGSNILPITRG